MTRPLGVVNSAMCCLQVVKRLLDASVVQPGLQEVTFARAVAAMKKPMFRHVLLADQSEGDKIQRERKRAIAAVFHLICTFMLEGARGERTCHVIVRADFTHYSWFSDAAHP